MGCGKTIISQLGKKRISKIAMRNNWRFQLILFNANCSSVKVISTRLKLMEEGKVTETQKNDLLSMMLHERDKYFTDQLVKSSVFTFLAAGRDTTATGLPGVLMYLAKVFSNFNFGIDR